MQELHSLPLRQRLELADSGNDQLEQYASPMLAMQQAFGQLAQAQPQLFALMMASANGGRRITHSTTTRRVTTHETPRKVFGIPCGTDIDHTISEDFRSESWEIEYE